MKCNTLFAAAVAASLAACTPQPAAVSDLDGAWLVQQIGGASLNAEERIYFTIDTEGGAIWGSTGCNEFSASITAYGETFAISGVTEQDAPCPNEAAGVNEARFLGVLPSVARYARRGAALELLAREPQADALILARTDDFAAPADQTP